MRLHLQPLLTAAAVALAPAAIATTSSSSNAIAPAALPTRAALHVRERPATVRRADWPLLPSPDRLVRVPVRY